MSPTPSHLKRHRPGTTFGIFVPLTEEEAEDLILGDDEDDPDDDSEDVSEDLEEWKDE